MESQDRRLRGQDRYLTGARLRRGAYRAPSPTGDHDPCEFCGHKLIGRGASAEADAVAAGWRTEDACRWVCDACFADFSASFGFVVLREGNPARGVELHDAKVLELTGHDGLVVVELRAFVHDDAKGASCAGCWQRIDLEFTEATSRRTGSVGNWVLDGSIRVDEVVIDNMLPIPLVRTGAVVATFTGGDFELTVHGRTVGLRVSGAPGKRNES